MGADEVDEGPLDGVFTGGKGDGVWGGRVDVGLVT